MNDCPLAIEVKLLTNSDAKIQLPSAIGYAMKKAEEDYRRLLETAAQ